MKIALGQMEIVYEQKEENLKLVEDWAVMAAKQGAELLLFPEMTATGFSMNVSLTGEPEPSGQTARHICAVARKYGIAIGFGWTGFSQKPEEVHRGKSEVLAHNHYSVADGQGKIIADYIKIHPFSYGGEGALFAGGTQSCIFTYRNHTFGVAICYDLRFPELFQQLSRQADTIIVAANWPRARLSQWDCLLQARAIENQSYVMGINCCGVQDKLIYAGGTRAFRPDGTALTAEYLAAEEEGVWKKVSEGLQEQAGMLLVEIGDEAEKCRREFPVKQDRKEDLYQKWYSV